LKREFLRKVKPVSCSPRETAGQPEQISARVIRRARTSAAMFGLALSVGASSLVLPHHDDGASAAEPKGTETPASSSQVATLPFSEQSSIAILPSTVTVEHVVREGQTLSQIARSYRVTVQDISAVNHLAADALLKPGQLLKIPVNHTDGVLKTALPELVASADLSQVPAVEQNTALSRLREQRDRLKDSLAELRSEGVKSSAVETHTAEVSIASISTASALTSQPAVNQSAVNQSAVNQSAVKPEIIYRVQPGDTLTAIARAHGISERSLAATNNLSDPDWIRVSDSLNVPSKPTAAPATLGQLAEVPSQPVVAQRPVARPAVQQVAIAPQMQDYQVGLGDTVARIAQAHNVSLSKLIDANRLSDPNVIFVGQVLHVPNVPASNVPVPSVPAPSIPAPSVPVSSAPTPSAGEVPVKPQALAIVPQAIPTSAVQDETSGTSDAAQASPRYVENLLAEVRALRAKHQGNIAVNSAVQQPTMVTAPREATPISAPVIPQPTTAGSSLVATASIHSENYAPLRQPVAGRTVSPDLPPLPGAEAFLPEGARSKGFIWPARGLLTSGYGWRWGRMHAGIDIAADVGTPVYAAANGVVEYSDWNSGGYGNLVDVRHPDGSLTRYAHLSRSLVHEGQRVRQGEQIAEMGSTGYSTGPHLHFEVHPKDEGAVNPIAYLPQQPVQ